MSFSNSSFGGSSAPTKQGPAPGSYTQPTSGFGAQLPFGAGQSPPPSFNSQPRSSDPGTLTPGQTYTGTTAEGHPTGPPLTITIGGQTIQIPPGTPPGVIAALQADAGLQAPQIANLQGQIGNNTTQVGAANLDYTQQTGGLNSTYQNQMGQLGLSQQGNAINQAAVGRQEGYYNQLYGLDQSDEARNVAYQNQLATFLNQQFGVAGGIHQSNLTQLGDQASQYKNQFGQNVASTNSADTATGAFTSQGHVQANQNLGSNLAYQLSNNKQQTLQENLGYLNTAIQHNQGEAGIQNTIAGLGSDLARSGLNHTEQIAQLQDRGQQLNLQAQSYGLNAQQYATTLQQGLANLNLNQTVTLGQLFDSRLSDNTQIQQIIAQIFQAGLGQGLYQ